MQHHVKSNLKINYLKHGKVELLRRVLKAWELNLDTGDLSTME